MVLRSIDAVDLAGRTVLVRADLNVPMSGGRITDATRIARFAPTVTSLRARGAKVVVMSHMGRPNGEPDPTLSLRPVAQALAEQTGADVIFIPDCVGAVSETAVGRLPEGGVALLENLRFYEGETKNSRTFALQLSVNGDIFVNDAFSAAHRAHASTAAITDILPSFAGPSMVAEISALTRALEAPQRPVAALVGGAKVSSKIAVLEHLLTRMDALIIGGGMANTFLASQGFYVGASLQEEAMHATAQRIMEKAKKHGCTILLPEDVIVADRFASDAQTKTVPVAAIPAGWMALDIGSVTLSGLIEQLSSFRTLLWNGPLGAFEMPAFAGGTVALALAAAERTEAGQLVSVAGGGDTVAALNAAGVAGQFTYLSTAGGAFLEWLEGKELPGVAALTVSEPIFEEA